jgi:hypothetical protein
MKKFLLWSFERGSRPYDVMCLVILAFIFLTPTRVFHDRPDFMRIVENEPIRRTKDINGNTVYTVQVHRPSTAPASSAEKAAIARLHEVIHEKFEISRMVPIHDTMGAVVAYSIWIDNGVQPF